MQKSYLKFSCIIFILSIFSITQASEVTHKDLEKLQSKATAKEIKKKLQQGNERYVNKDTRAQQFRKQAKFAAIEGQFPLAFVLNCMDSRSIPQVIFDQAAGSLFVGRVAGNVVSTNMIASMEYAAFVGTKLFVIMGHTKCGAINASCQGGGFGNIKSLINEIEPAVKKQKEQLKQSCTSEKLIQAITIQNVVNMIDKVSKLSPFLAKKIKDNDIKIVGAIHDIKTGKVNWL